MTVLAELSGNHTERKRYLNRFRFLAPLDRSESCHQGDVCSISDQYNYRSTNACVIDELVVDLISSQMM